MTAPRPIRAAVISAGAWSQHSHLPTLLGDPEVEVVAATSPDAAVRRRISAHWPGLTVLEDWTQALDSAPDLVVVSSPPAIHPDQVVAALEHGAVTLVEKPFAVDSAAARRMTDTARRTGRPLLVGFSWSSCPAIRAALPWISAVGRIDHVQATLSVNTRGLLTGAADGGWGGSATTTSSTYTDVRLSGGGAGAVSTAHLLSVVLWLTGLRPTSVVGTTSPVGAPIDLHLSLLGRTADGATLSLDTVSAQPNDTMPQWQLGVYGPGGDVRVDTRNHAAWFTPAAGGAALAFREPDAGDVDQHYPTRAALDVARGAAVPAALDAALGQDVVAVTEAAYRSTRTGGWEVVAA